MKFMNLHQHTTYSFLDGYGLPSQYIERVKKLGQKGLALTEHGNIYSHIPFTLPFAKAGLHLIYGVEFYVVDDLTLRQRGYYHITVLAKTNEGYQNLLALVNLSALKGPDKGPAGHFYYKPRISYAELVAYSKGLIVFTGCCCDGFFIGEQEKGWTKRVDKWCRDFKKVEWYVELQPFKDEQEKWDNLSRIVNRYSLPAIITADSHYPGPEHKDVQDFQLAINMCKGVDDVDRLKLDYPLYVPSGEEMAKRGEAMGGCYKREWVTNTEAIGLSCDVVLPSTTMVKLHTKISTLQRKCSKRLREIGLNLPEYRARLKRELNMIKEKDFADYFALVGDLCVWAKKSMLVGPARGSSAGSLVCYLLRITEVDPIIHSLLFERFIDVNRKDLPDIDLDFPSDRREEVIQYLRDKYGKDCTSQLITFATFKPKAILQSGGRSLNIPPWEIKEAGSQIIERSGGDARASFCLKDSIEQFDKLRAIFDKYPRLRTAIPLEGQVQRSGIHAAAVVISSVPLNQVGSVNKDGAFGMDKRHIEEYGLLKIDVLGIETLTIIEDICRATGQDPLALYNLPLDDEKVYDRVFKSISLLGIFQFEGLVLQQTCGFVLPSTFEELVHITALSRPGPLNSGGTDIYIARHNGEAFKYTKGLEPYTSDTYGVIIYQEQVMRVVKDLGHFGWDSVGAVRKAMSKSLGEEFFNKYKKAFVQGAAKEGIEAFDAEQIWKQIMTHGSWSFNKSHAVSYALLSYWTAYLKAYWPAQFYARILKGEKDEERIKRILREWGGPFKGIDINLSKEDWTVSPDGETLVGGLTSIKGIGDKKAQLVISNQPFKDEQDFKSRVAKGVAKTVLTAAMEGSAWEDLSSLKDRMAEQMEGIECTAPFVHLRDVINSPYRTSFCTIARVEKVLLRDLNEASKVEARKSEANPSGRVDGLTEYFVLRVGDEEAMAPVYFNPKTTAKSKQELSALKGKICLFRLNRVGGDLLAAYKFLVLS